MTILAMSGLGMFTPNFANAAASAGDLIKMEGNSSVYYFDGAKRFVFPNEATYFSWYSDFSGVVTIPSSELQSYLLGGNVTMRPGTKLVKITTDPSVYAVEANGVLRKIQNEAQAASLYGSDWAKRVVDVPDAFFTNYTIGTALASGSVPAGSLVKNAGSSNVYYFDGTNYRAIGSEAAMNANRFSFANVLTISNTITAGGNAITGMESALVKTSQGGTTTGPIVTGSGLMVSLNAGTPGSASVPKTVSRVPFTTVNLTASNDGAINLSSLTVKRSGLTTITGGSVQVWAEHNGKSVTSKRTLNNDEASLTFSPAITIAAGQTISLNILAELDNVDGNMALGIASASAVSASAASVTGSFPVTGNLMSFTQYTVSTVQFDGGVDTGVQIEVGDENVLLGEFDLTSATPARDLMFQSITLRNSGLEELSKVLMNVRLENNGDIVSDYATFDGRYVTFNLKDGGLSILKDDFAQTFSIIGDVIAKDVNSADSLNLSVQRTSDISIYEKATGFGVTFNDATSKLDIAEIEIKAGKVTVAKKATSPSATTLNKGANNVVALLANVKVDEAIKAEGLTVTFETATSTAGAELISDNFQNVKVYLNNILLSTFNLDDADIDFVSGDQYTYLIDSFIDFNKGDNEIKVMVDVKNDAQPGATFSAMIDGDSTTFLSFAEYVVSGIAVVAGDVSGQASGAIFDVQGADLDFVKTDGYSDLRKTVQGAQNFSLGKFTVRAVNDKVRINSLVIASTTDNTIPYTDLTSLKLLRPNGTQIGSTVSLNSAGVANFSSLNLDLAKDEVLVIELVGNISSTAANSGNKFVKLDVKDLVARDGQNKVITGINDLMTSKLEVVGAGTLTIEALTEPSDMYLASKSGVEQVVGRFEFTSANDAANISEIVLENISGDTIDPRVNSLKLYDGSTLVAESFLLSGEAEFKNLNNKFIVSAGSGNSKVLTVHATFNDIDDIDVDASGLKLKLEVKSVEFRTSAGQLIDSVTLTNATSSEFIIVKSVPTVAKQSLSSNTLTFGANSNKQIARFTVNADANGRVNVATTTLEIATSSAVVSGTVVLRDGTTNVPGTYKIDGNNIVLVPTSLNVAAGQSKTFDVFVDITTAGENSSVSTKLIDSNFEWNDNVGSGYTGVNIYGLDLPISWDLSR